MRSLRTRLIALWVMLAASALVTGFLLLESYRQSANVQVAQAEDLVVRACRDIGDRYAFFVTGWTGGKADIDERLRSDLHDVVQAALARSAGVEGGIWQSAAGSLTYAFPTYEGTGPKTDLPAAELPSIRQANLDALRSERPITVRQNGQSQVLVLHACPFRAIGTSPEQLTELASPPPRGGPRGEPKPKGPGRGPAEFAPPPPPPGPRG
jgi:hypothetical protein